MLLYWLGFLILCFGVLVGLQNPEDVVVNLFGWQSQLPLSVLVLVFLLVGMVLGWTMHWLSQLIPSKKS